jgi:hypothetical protein
LTTEIALAKDTTTMTTSQRAVGAMLLVGVLTGCATAPSVAPVPRGESVVIDVVRSPPVGGDSRIRNLAISDNTTTGAGSGVVIGALYGLSCGPFALICVPLGAMVGGATGSAAGAVVGLTGALSEDNAAKVLARLAQVQKAHDLIHELNQNVTERAAVKWSLGSAAPTYTVRIELQDIRVTSTRDERIGFAVSVLVNVRPAGAEHKAGMNEKLFEYVGPFVGLAEWIDERSDVLDGNLSVASKQLALQIVAELSRR